jgi:hypothetical protein
MGILNIDYVSEESCGVHPEDNTNRFVFRGISSATGEPSHLAYTFRSEDLADKSFMASARALMEKQFRPE